VCVGWGGGGWGVFFYYFFPGPSIFCAVKQLKLTMATYIHRIINLKKMKQ
jgi:hypothetical protein